MNNCNLVNLFLLCSVSGSKALLGASLVAQRLKCLPPCRRPGFDYRGEQQALKAGAVKMAEKMEAGV